MAFVFRSEKLTDKLKKELPHLGPGTYFQNSIIGFKPSVAPFHSKSPRKLHEENINPGPGYYDSLALFDKIMRNNPNNISKNKGDEENLLSLLQAAKNKERVGFNSTEKRFSQKGLNSNPGPGDYKNENIDYIERKSGKAFISPINYIRLPNAPSIPSHEFVFGYDETEDGELVQQENPNLIYSGRKNDNVGPGNYETLKSMSSPNKGTNWHYSRKLRDVLKPDKKQKLGPGSYHLQGQVEQKSATNLAFVSKVPKGSGFDNYLKVEVIEEENPNSPIQIDDATPGPGYYVADDTKNANTLASSNPNSVFNSKFSRFEENKRINSLGPGQYNHLKSHIFHKTSYAAPFQSTINRFKVLPRTLQCPGPGTYKEKGIIETIVKKIYSKNGIFGTTNKRFTKGFKEIAPGPGAYEQAKSSSNFEKHSLSNISEEHFIPFLSTLNRFKQKEKVEVQVPYKGQEINTIKENIDKAKSNQFSSLAANIRLPRNWSEAPFNSKSLRILKNQNLSTGKEIGPGKYDYDSDFSKKKVEEKGKIMVYEEARFLNNEKAIPGPGQYNNLNSLKKKTFNMLFLNKPE